MLSFWGLSHTTIAYAKNRLLTYGNVCAEQAMAVGMPPLLAGRASRDIMLDIERLHSSDAPRQKTIELFSKLFAVSYVWTSQ